MTGSDPTSFALEGASTDDLYAQLGGLLTGQSLGLGPRGRRNLVRDGREWLEDHFDRLSAELCGSPALEPFRGANNADLSSLILVLPAFAKPTEAFGLVVAALLVRRGIDQLCDG